MAALTCLRSVETNLTLTCPSPKSFVCNLPDSGRHVTSVFQGLSLSRSVGRVGENPGNEVANDPASASGKVTYWPITTWARVFESNFLALYYNFPHGKVHSFWTLLIKARDTGWHVKGRSGNLEIWDTGSAEIRIIRKSVNLKSTRNRRQIKKTTNRDSCIRVVRLLLDAETSTLRIFNLTNKQAVNCLLNSETRLHDRLRSANMLHKKQ